MGPVDAADIKTFLAKPQLIFNGVYDSSLSAGAAIFGEAIEDLLFGVLAKKVYTDKLSGYRLFRGTAVIRIVLNCQPFQAGRLIIHFLPQKQNFNDYSTTFTAIHLSNLTSITQQPNVEFDIHDGVAELEIPYVAPSNWHTREAPFNFGTVYASVLSPLRSAAATNVDFAVYAYFKDFELTAPQFGPEMNASMSKVSTKERKRTRKVGVVSNFLDAVAKPFDLLRGVPIVGPNAGLISDATIQISKVFSMFGWSRPIDMSPVSNMRLQPNYQAFNYNGQNSSDMLSMDAANQVAPMNNFGGSGVDEMSFNYLKGIPALYTDFEVTTSQTSDTVVFTQSIGLPSFTRTVPTTGTGSYVYRTSYAPPFIYLSRYFNYWRGGIVITLKFVKTAFHSGRYEIAYTPSNNGAGVPSTTNPYLFREVIDISVDDVFSFVIPYYSEVPWQSTAWRGSTANDANNGILTVSVLNKLVASSTVSSAVNVLVYASAADDFQLSGLVPVNKPAFVPEMSVPRVVGPIGNAAEPSLSVDPVALCSGEVFTSIKQLFQCARPLRLAPFVTPNFLNVKFWPYALGLPNLGITDGSLRVPDWYGDYLSELALGFAYNRGGVRIFSPQAAAGNSLSWRNYSSPGEPIIQNIDELPGPVDASFTIDNGSFLACPANRTATGCSLDVIMPHGSKTPFRLSYPIRAAAPIIPFTKDSPQFMINMRIPVVTAPALAEPYPFYRSGADDFAVAYFIGFPGFLESVTPPG